MALEAYVGKVGGGKTYSAILRMCEHVSRGGLVATNIRLNMEAFERLCRLDKDWKVQPGQVLQLVDEVVISNFWDHVPKASIEFPVLVIIDEATEWLDASGQRSAQAKEFLSYCRQSRKQGQDLIFISQSVMFLDVAIRRMIEYQWTFRDMARFRVPGLGVRTSWLKVIRQMRWSGDGKELISTWSEPKSQYVYDCYNTLQTYRTFGKNALQCKTDFRGKGKIKRARGAVLVDLLKLAACVALVVP